MLHPFHANIFARPAHAVVGATIDLRGVALPTLQARAFDAFFPITFEQAIAALAALPRLDAEPDGFFVITGEEAGRRWQLDGHLYDFGDQLHRVELHGDSPAAAFDAILACLGWPATPLAFELVMEGIALDESAFRQLAAQPPS